MTQHGFDARIKPTNRFHFHIFFSCEVLVTYQSRSWSSILRLVSGSVDFADAVMLTGYTALYQTSDKTSFAYISARDRWPVILVSVTGYPHFLLSKLLLPLFLVRCGSIRLCAFYPSEVLGGKNCDGQDFLEQSMDRSNGHYQSILWNAGEMGQASTTRLQRSRTNNCIRQVPSMTCTRQLARLKTPRSRPRARTLFPSSPNSSMSCSMIVNLREYMP